MSEGDFFVDMEPVEDMYGGGSRTKHVILKRRHASLSQSVFSAPIGKKVSPNRDYPYEGFFGMIGLKNWKFMDTIAAGVKMDGEPCDLANVNVHASPWECTYTYAGPEGLDFRVSYFLYETHEGASGYVHATASGPDAGRLAIVLEPYFDIRFMYGASYPDRLTHEADNDTLIVIMDRLASCVSVEGSTFNMSEKFIDWKYKLGSGSRYKADDRARFIPDVRRIRSFGEFEREGAEALLKFSFNDSISGAKTLLHTEFPGPSSDHENAMKIKESMASGMQYTRRMKDIILRAIGMSRFGIDVDGKTFMEAGDFWFRTVWFRDLFEGLIHNFNAINMIHGLEGIKEILLKSFELQDEYGRIPNRLVASGNAGSRDYNSADATLAGITVKETGDDSLAKASGEAIKKCLKNTGMDIISPEGPPVVNPNGLLSVPSWHSWIDGRRMVDGRNLPIRVSEIWERELIEQGAENELYLQRFYLPEINAQWIKALEAGWLFGRYTRDYKTADQCKWLYYKALNSYKPLFYNHRTGFLNNLTTTETFALGARRDDMICSTGVISAAMLGLDVFTIREIESIASVTKSRLIRTKWGMPFGTVVRSSGIMEYYGDSEYHEEVVWPRDTPYLIKLFEITDDKKIIEGILESNLRHQMEESFVFYNNELFSPDCDLVPVKNPVQWWSQWVDPYL